MRIMSRLALSRRIQRAQLITQLGLADALNMIIQCSKYAQPARPELLAAQYMLQSLRDHDTEVRREKR